ncbi:ketopantoate reductase family protein [Nocardia seriolae]|uniref:ketopantoate reductase family protein n=1 Tax=Nocardia seriolae TaxID=37332 RepID=UPI0004B3D8C5|nr:2-dehydropantoate 2-reductase N-terminal domain-containing protein [Nocardia seriolae]MTJ63800.1 hypothetical protein [Nocardia seriolae]MTJ72262.1 hypothetical protein [Nocardia seriolae]MTJ88361.1 hypothetical protein [Nocardia seriolae]MTK32346.1 hypothetical protein [Nocardia seriolae]MTK41687.1 hypothetical protein [Nocardia seriolae]
MQNSVGGVTRVLVLGAGVIGRVYAARLAAAGTDVELLARGSTLRALARQPITLRSRGRSQRVPVSVVDTARGRYHAVLVAVRRDQLDSALAQLDSIDCGEVVTLCNHPLGLDELRARIGPERLIAGLPGVGGYLADDGGVEYLEIRQQPTTLEQRGGHEPAIAEMLRRAGFAVATTGRMDDWLATHAVCIVAMCAALERAGYDASALAHDRPALAALVRAVRAGFRGLGDRGIETVPAGLVFLFTRTPTAFAAAYWGRALRGPLGAVAFAPHARAARDTEIAALRADVARLLPPGTAPDLDAFLSGGGVTSNPHRPNASR